MAEVFSWPEATLHLWTAGGGANSAALVHAQGVSLTISQRFDKRITFATAGGIAGRTRFTHLETDVTLRVQQMWAGQGVAQMLKSATAMNAVLSASSLVATAAWQLWSAVPTQIQLDGGIGGLFMGSFQLQAADASAHGL